MGMEKHRLGNAKSPYCWSCQCHPVPSVAFWNVKKKLRKPKLRWEWKNTGFKTPNPFAAADGQCCFLECQKITETTVSRPGRLVRQQQHGDLAFWIVFSIPTVVLAFFLTFQKATLGTGSLSRPGRLVLQQHGDMAFRSLCFSILNLNVVLAFFLTFQKATLGTGSLSRPGCLILQQNGDMAFRSLCFSIPNFF